MKHLHRLIVTSSTYRMSASAHAHGAEIDPDNHSLWRMPVRRMEAELIRDGVLFVAGRLDLTMGGPELDHQKGLEITRRSLYFRHAQEKQMPLLKMFDCAAVTECYERKESIIPQQALALMNSQLTFVGARALARSLSDLAQSDEPFVRAAFESVLSRPAATAEIAVCLDYLSAQAEMFSQTPPGAASASNLGDLSQPAADAQLRARENLVQVLLNHNDFVSVR